MNPKPNTDGAAGVSADVNMDALERAADSRLSYDFGRRAMREVAVREGREPPLFLHEFIWAKEGPVDNDRLDTVRNG